MVDEEALIGGRGGGGGADWMLPTRFVVKGMECGRGGGGGGGIGMDVGLSTTVMLVSFGEMFELIDVEKTDLLAFERSKSGRSGISAKTIFPVVIVCDWD